MQNAWKRSRSRLFFVVNLICFTWWRNLKDQFRNIVKAQKSGSGGTLKETKWVQWQFYNKMNFMKNYIYSRRYISEVASCTINSNNMQNCRYATCR